MNFYATALTITLMMPCGELAVCVVTLWEPAYCCWLLLLVLFSVIRNIPDMI